MRGAAVLLVKANRFKNEIFAGYFQSTHIHDLGDVEISKSTK